MRRGLKLLEERDGTGLIAQKGSRVIYNLRVYLNKGNEVPISEVAGHPPEVVRHDEAGDLLNLVCTIGERDAFAAVEYTLEGMREGGYRKIRSKPHLAYGEAGIPGKIPKNAIVTFEVWLRKVGTGA